MKKQGGITMAIKMMITPPEGWTVTASTETTYEPSISLFGCALYWVTEKDLTNDMTRRYLQVKKIPGKNICLSRS